ncbi:MAG: glycerate kinase [Methanomassiliicoccales archaeon]
MDIQDREDLVRDREVREHLLQVLEAAVDAVDPYNAVMNALELEGDVLRVDGTEYDLSGYCSVYVVGGGKATAGMARAVNELIGDRITEGLVNVLEEGEEGAIELHRSSHPHPSEEGMEGAKRIMNICSKAKEKDLVIALISGGGSAMMPLPCEGITVEEKRETAEKLMEAGVTINELNAVRKHLSMIKGGQMAKAAFPADIISLIMSDVVDDPLEGISSGPTAPDGSTFQDALDVIERYHLIGEMPDSVMAHLRKGEGETPDREDQVFDKVQNLVVANNRIALMAAEGMAMELGYSALLLSSSLEGEAREVGTALAAMGNEVLVSSHPLPPPCVLLAGGETTVTVRGNGTGGRNSEMVLSALRKIREGVTFLSFGSDGVDGKSHAGGAMTDLFDRMDDLERFLENNDSATYMEREGGLIVTGPTGTNVGDIVLLAIPKKE